MTGLPPLPQLPPPPPAAEPAAGAARAWVEAACSLGNAGADVRRALGVGSDWSGAAAHAAAGRALREDTSAVDVAARGLSQARGVGDWAASLVDLHRSHAVLVERRRRLDQHLARLVPLPDDVPGAGTLRHGAWAEHDDVCAAVDAWRSARDAADARLVRTLREPGRPSLLAATDGAWRSLLGADRSAAGEATRAALGASDGSAYLLEYAPERFGGDGAVVIAYGDPTTADDVAVVVPGMTNDATTMAGVGALATAVRRAATAASPTTRTASIAWLGYDAPSGSAGRVDLRRPGDLARALSPAAAEDGAAELAAFVDRVAVRTAGPVTVIGHSYGSTTAAIAAREGLDADRLVLLGSPGAGPGVEHADDLGVPTWVASDDLDPVTWVGSARAHGGPGILGADPAQHDFGALRLPTGATPAPHLDEGARFTEIHLAYLRPGSPTLDAVGAVVTGQPALPVPARTSGGMRLAAHWVAGQAAYELTSWR